MIGVVTPSLTLGSRRRTMGFGTPPFFITFLLFTPLHTTPHHSSHHWAPRWTTSDHFRAPHAPLYPSRSVVLLKEFYDFQNRHLPLPSPAKFVPRAPKGSLKRLQGPLRPPKEAPGAMSSILLFRARNLIFDDPYCSFATFILSFSIFFTTKID